MIENQKPPVNYNIPIPNTSGSYPEVYYVNTPEGPAFLGDGLTIDPETGIMSSTGGGIPLTPLNTYIYSLADLGNNVLLAGGENGFVYRSSNGGAAWDSGRLVTSRTTRSLSTAGGTNALAGSWGDTFAMFSDDQGQTWVEGEDFNSDEVDAFGFAGGNTVYAGTYGYIFRSDDGGVTWPQSTSPYYGDYYTCFAFPGPEEVVVGSYDYGFISYSIDGGQTWDYTSDYVLDGAEWIYGLASNGDGKVIAGTNDNGKVFLSTDSGQTWDGGTQLGDATAVHSVAFSDGVFYAGTDDLGKIFKSTDLGATWQLFYNPNSPNADVLALTFNTNNEVVAAINNFIVRIPKSYTPPQYIYCTSPFGNLPVTYPPYECNTEVNTTGVTDFTDAWFNCQYLTEFPCVDSSAVTDFSYAWEYCYSLTSFPTINTSAGENFTCSWAYSGLTSFPKLNTSNGSIFYGTWSGCYDLASFPDLDLGKGIDFSYSWYYCTSLSSFPSLDLSSGTTFHRTWRGCYSLFEFPPLDFSKGLDFSFSWNSCFNLASFPANVFDRCISTNFLAAWSGCALSQQSVDNILVSLNTAGQSNGVVNIDGGTSAAPSATGLAAKASLEGKGWTVTVNAAPLGESAEEPKKTGRKRARDEEGQFKGDDPSTLDKNEAWVTNITN